MIGSVAQELIMSFDFMVFTCHGHRFKDMIRAMEANPAVTRPVIHKHFKFEDAIKAYAYLESQVHTGKVVIQVSKH